jgi:hypothetical protein
MSHVSSGFTVTDITAMQETIKENCPTLKMVKKEHFRTWIDDHGGLVGDYVLPGVYQYKILKEVLQAKTAEELEKKTGIKVDLETLIQKPLTLKEWRSLMQDSDVSKKYHYYVKNVVGKDAEFVITSGKNTYDIGVVRCPKNPKEYHMLTDFYNQGKGLLKEPGVGQHKVEDGKDVWATELKQEYSVRAARKSIERQLKTNPAYRGAKVTEVKTPRGVRFQIQMK